MFDQACIGQRNCQTNVSNKNLYDKSKSFLLSLGKAYSPSHAVASENEVGEVVIWWKGMEPGEEKRNLQVLAVLWLESVLVAATTERIWRTEKKRKKI